MMEVRRTNKHGGIEYWKSDKRNQNAGSQTYKIRMMKVGIIRILEVRNEKPDVIRKEYFKISPPVFQDCFPINIIKNSR